MNIGEKVKHFRLLANISSKQLAYIVGLTPSQITKIETNVNNPSLESLTRICESFGITLADFFKEESIEDKIPSELDKHMFVVKKLPPEDISLLTQLAEKLYRNSPKEKLDKNPDARLDFIRNDPNPTLVLLFDMNENIDDLISKLKKKNRFNSALDVLEFLGAYRDYTREKESILSHFTHTEDKDVIKNIQRFYSSQEKFVNIMIAKINKTVENNNDLPEDQKQFLENIIEGLKSGKWNEEGFDPGLFLFEA